MEDFEDGFDPNRFMKITLINNGYIHSILYGRPSDLENFVCIINTALQKAVINRGSIYKAIETTIDGMFEFLAERNIDYGDVKERLIAI